MNILKSSSDSKKLSMTVQGILMGLVPLLIAIFQSSGIEVSETVLIDMVQQITTIISALVMTYGLVRKFWNLGLETFSR